MIEVGLVEGSSHREALGSVFNHGCDFCDLDAISIKLEVKIDVFNKATQIVTLEIWGELKQKGLNVCEVDEWFLVTKLQFEEVKY